MNVLEELNLFYNNFKGEKGFLGQTENKKLIPFFKVKKTDFPVVIVQCGIHAREFITTYLCIKLIKDYILSGKMGTVYFIPAVNLDGIEICLTINPLYKANFNGVDLNVNFDAKFGTGEKNVLTCGSENYVGAFPFSESETRALRDFTLLVNPDVTLSYHSKGEEIYFDFFQDEIRYKRDFLIAKKLSLSTGYKIVTGLKSAGGYKDWCIEKLKIPSFTIEVGKDSLTHPILKENLLEIYKKNKDVIKILTETDYGRKVYDFSDIGSQKGGKRR